MKQFDELLNELESATDIVKEGLDNYRKAKELLNYWSPDNCEQRKRNEQAVKEWRYKEYTLQENFKILWAFMIGFIILEIIFFGKIGLWFDIENNMIVFLLLGGTFIILTIILAFVLFNLRK